MRIDLHILDPNTSAIPSSFLVNQLDGVNQVGWINKASEDNLPFSDENRSPIHRADSFKPQVRPENGLDPRIAILKKLRLEVSGN